MSAGSDIRERATAVAALLGIKRIAPQIAARLNDSELEPVDRAAALQSLVRLDPKQALAFAKSVKVRPANELTEAAIQVLGDLDQTDSLTTFIEATKSSNVKLRQRAWDILGQSKSLDAASAIGDGIRRYIGGSLSPDVHLNVLEAAKGKLDQELQQQLDEHRTALSATSPFGPLDRSFGRRRRRRGAKTILRENATLLRPLSSGGPDWWRGRTQSKQCRQRQGSFVSAGIDLSARR